MSGAAKVISSPKGRAVQMNTGARHAKGNTVLFLHADSELPSDWIKFVQEGIDKGRCWGCFRTIDVCKDVSSSTPFDAVSCDNDEQ